MKLYKVTWDMDIEASDPQEAALFASEMMDDKTGRVFEVTNLDTYEVTVVDVEHVHKIEELKRIIQIAEKKGINTGVYFDSWKKELAVLERNK